MCEDDLTVPLLKDPGHVQKQILSASEGAKRHGLVRAKTRQGGQRVMFFTWLGRPTRHV